VIKAEYSALLLQSSVSHIVYIYRNILFEDFEVWSNNELRMQY